MRKIFYLLVGVILFTGCGITKDYTSWKNLYEPVVAETIILPEVFPKTPQVVAEQPVKKEQPEKIVMRREEVKLTHGADLKNYCVIVGSFGEEQNAVNLRELLIGLNYTESSIMRNTEGMNRVSVGTYDNEQEARDALYKIRQERSEYADAWLLIKK